MPLSRREREVATLVADGLTDREIARRLSISERTAEGHVQQIRNKLGFDNRAQIATWMTKRIAGLTAGTAQTPTANPLPRHDLPAQLTSFIGRGRELGEIRRLLQQARLVTITGPGGCGKTRLAVEVAAEVHHRYPGGLSFVDLSSVTDPNVVPRAVAAAMGVSEREGADPLQAVATELVATGRSTCLVILDNCEHLVDRCAITVETLLRTCPHLTFLCTSRERLHVAGEAIWNLGPLSLPEPGRTHSLEAIRKAEAVRLFVDRARLSDSEFEINEANAADVAQLCQQLDGIALALELAAARVGSMSFAELQYRLEEHFSILRARSVQRRQQTLGAMLGWSYDLLSEPERRLLRRLSVFSGGFTVEAAELVCADRDHADRGTTFDLLTLLVDKSLVVPAPPRRERYGCLHIIRRYAAAKLAESGEMDSVRRRHFEFYLGVAERASKGLTGPEQPEWLGRLGDDHDNLRAALETSRSYDVETRLRLVLALEQFWQICGHLGEGREWIEDAVAASSDVGATTMRARVLNAAAGLAWQQGDTSKARADLEASLSDWRELGERRGIQACLANLGVIASAQYDWGRCRSWLEESLALARDLGDERATAIALNNLGLLEAYLGEHEAALACFDEGLVIMRNLGDPVRMAISLVNLGLLDLYQGHIREASQCYAESLHFLEGLGAMPTLAECLEGFACIAAKGGRYEQAVRLAGAAASIRERIGRPLPPWSQRLMNSWIEEARQYLRASAQDLWREGGELSVTQAIVLALEERLDTKEVSPAGD